MKKNNLFKFIALYMICACTFISCSDNDGNDGPIIDPVETFDDIALTIPLSSYNGTTTPSHILTVAACNAGATQINEPGTFYTWQEAVDNCPEGYHLMTSDEYVEITDYIATTPEKLTEILKTPFAGYYDGSELKQETYGFYWLADEGYYSPETDAYAARTKYDEQYSCMEYPNEWDKSLKMQVRYVKDVITPASQDITIHIPESSYQGNITPAHDIIVAGQNMGASSNNLMKGAPLTGELLLGNYYTWEKAKNACPQGYHVMTSNEYAEITEILDTPEKLMETLKMPFAGYYEGSELKQDTYGFYWLADEGYYYPETDAYAARTKYDEQYSCMEYPNEWAKSLQMQVRYVKD